MRKVCKGHFPHLIGLHTCFQHTAEPQIRFPQMRRVASMDVAYIRWGFQPHLGTFHISSLCAGINDTVVADLQLWYATFFAAPEISLNKTSWHTDSSEHKIQTRRAFSKKKHLSIFSPKKKTAFSIFTHPTTAIFFLRWIQPRWAWGHCLASKWAILPPSEVSSKETGWKLQWCGWGDRKNIEVQYVCRKCILYIVEIGHITWTTSFPFLILPSQGVEWEGSIVPRLAWERLAAELVCPFCCFGKAFPTLVAEPWLNLPFNGGLRRASRDWRFFFLSCHGTSWIPRERHSCA